MGYQTCNVNHLSDQRALTFSTWTTQGYKAVCSGHSPGNLPAEVDVVGVDKQSFQLPLRQPHYRYGPRAASLSVDSARLAGAAVGLCLEPLERRSRQCSQCAVHVQCLVPLCRQAPTVRRARVLSWDICIRLRFISSLIEQQSSKFRCIVVSRGEPPILLRGQHRTAGIRNILRLPLEWKIRAAPC